METNEIPKSEVKKQNLKVVILAPHFHEEIVSELLQNCEKELFDCGVKKQNIEIRRVAGALEIPFACQKIIKTAKPDVIIALGAVIRGKTSHYDLVCTTTYQGIMEIQLRLGVPIVFGILTCENLSQAKRRASAKGENKGKSFARTAILQATFK